MDLPVRLLFAQAIVTRVEPAGNGAYTHWGVEAFVELKNIAYQKDVRFRWWGYNMDPQDTQAVYLRSSNCNQEIWHIVSPTRRVWSHAGSSEPIRFAINYQVSGESYWDNNRGQDYSVQLYASPSSRFSLGALKVLLLDASTGGSSFKGSIVVKHLGNVKRIQVIYTTDGWTHFQAIEASYCWGEQQQEDWEFSAPPGSLGDAVFDEIRFAIKYEVNDITYWDNNAGLDYSVSTAGSISVSRLTLEDIVNRLAVNE
jgi:hypothetical protein